MYIAAKWYDMIKHIILQINSAVNFTNADIHVFCLSMCVCQEKPFNKLKIK